MLTLLSRFGVACLALLFTAGLAHAVDIDLRNTDGTKTPWKGLEGAGYVRLAHLLGCEHADEVEALGYCRVVGGVVVPYTAMTGVITNTTSATFTLPSGGKTPMASVTGTGAVTATLKLYGAMTSTAALGKLLSTITLSDTTTDIDFGTQFTADYPHYYATSENVTGTGATVEFIIATGIAGSGSSSGGGEVTNGGTFVVQESGGALTALQLLDNVVRTEDAAETAAGGLAAVGAVRRDVAASSADTTGDNATINTDALGQLWVRHLDPCSGIAKTSIPINIVTATTTELTSALAGASTHYYVCSIDLVTAGANNVALVDDDSDGCGSVTSGLAGGTTAATGWNFAANGGIAKGNGNATVFKTGGTNRVICLVTSAAVQLSGSIQVVAAP